MKKCLFYLIIACMLINLLPFGAFAEEAEATEETAAAEEAAADPKATSGTCGDGLTWSLEDGVLTISGSGEMDDGDPWSSHRVRIRRVVLSGGVTKIGKECFKGYDWLESVDFGDSLVEIGERAFYGCTELRLIHLPATFKIFGAECFRECVNLQKVYCEGGMPRFNSSCLWCGDYIAVFYRTNNVWPYEYVGQLVNSYGGRMGIMMGNYEDTVEAELEQKTYGGETLPEETEAPTEAPAEAPVEVPTEAPVVITEPVVQETEAAEVIYITAPADWQEQEQTQPETRPEEPVFRPVEETEPEEPVDLTGKSWIGIVLIAGVITFLLAGAMIFRSAMGKGGRYDR